MATTQQRIMKTITDRLDAAGFEHSIDGTYANLQTVRVSEPGSPAQSFAIRLNFQDGYVSGGIFLEGDRPVNNAPFRGNSPVHERRLHARYDSAVEMNSFATRIAAFIAAHAPAARPAAEDEAEKVYSPMGALQEIYELLDGTCDPDDPDHYVSQALRIARRTLEAARARNAAPDASSPRM